MQDVQARAISAFSQQPANGQQGFACFTETSVLLLLVASGVISMLIMATIFLVL